jgi:hypothetical protein
MKKSNPWLPRAFLRPIHMASIPRKTRSTSSLKIGKTMAVGGARFLPGGFFVKGMRDLGRVTAEKGRQEPVNSRARIQSQFAECEIRHNRPYQETSRETRFRQSKPLKRAVRHLIKI